MSIYTVPFSVYEKLASAKMNSFASSINAHTHDGSYGVKIPFSYLDGYLDVSKILANTITGDKLVDYTILAIKIANSILDMTKMDNNTGHTNSLKLSSTGYALYAP
jgi:hypothetical protein